MVSRLSAAFSRDSLTIMLFCFRSICFMSDSIEVSSWYVVLQYSNSISSWFKSNSRAASMSVYVEGEDAKPLLLSA